MSGFTPDVIPDRGTLLPTCLVVLACFCFGTIPYFAKSLTDSGMASYAVAFYRYGLSALVLILWAAPEHSSGMWIPRHETILAICGMIIIGREIVISALREWMAELGSSGTVAVTGIAKIKTIFQLVGVGAMLYTYPIFGFIPAYGIGFLLVVGAAGLTVWSMYIYLKAAWPLLTIEE